MTGRALYDRFCDAAKAKDQRWRSADDQLTREPLRAWPFLTTHDRDVWNGLAKRLPARRSS